MMQGQGKLVAGLLLGAGGMYLLDPDRGARRRSLLRDRSVRTRRVLGEGAATVARDVRNRSTGAAAALRSRFRSDEAGDEIIHERVRAALGRAVSHPGAVHTAVFDGRVFLSGPVLAHELSDLLAAVRRVRGVREVENQLQVHERPGSVPGLQGEGRARGGQSMGLGEAWTPTTRLLAGAVGGLLALVGLRSRGLAGTALAALGGALLTRAGTNRTGRELVGAGVGSDVIEVDKTLTVAVPLEQVWDLWSDFENFPRFLAHLREVRRGAGDRSHWTAVGPAGIPVEWEAETTEWRPHEAISWRSLEGSTVNNSGTVRFRRVGEAATEIDLRISYSPPGGVIGHAVAALLGGDLKRLLDDDMVRLKSLLEEGRTSAGGGQVELTELEDRREAGRPW